VEKRSSRTDIPVGSLRHKDWKPTPNCGTYKGANRARFATMVYVTHGLCGVGADNFHLRTDCRKSAGRQDFMCSDAEQGGSVPAGVVRSCSVAAGLNLNVADGS
jgi:hypothetical protein